MAALPTIEILRPDDLVVLRIATDNLVLDRRDPAAPVLVRADAQAAAHLIVHFPPQAFAEEAFAETAIVQGLARVRLGGESRLVFAVPATVSAIPYSVAGLLDWSELELQLPPAAAVPAGETPDGDVGPARPGRLETSIEQPYRLIMAPGPGLTFAGPPHPVVANDRAELWHARLRHAGPQGGEVTRTAPGSARAVYSPDYRGVVKFGGQTTTDPPGWRMSLKPYHRHSLVALMSGFGDYEAPKTILIPFGGIGKDFKLVPITVDGEYVPPPAVLDDWALSALGGSLHLSWHWGLADDGAGPRNGDVRMDISAWKHVATQGRDHYVKVVQEGVLYPFGHRAALVTVTERRFEGERPVALLRQYQYVIVRAPYRSFEGLAFRHGGREMPLGDLRLLTLSTPHLLMIGEDPEVKVGTASQWLRANTPPNEHVPFRARAHDADGEVIELTSRLIFSPLSAMEDDWEDIQAAYAADDARRCELSGQNVGLAPDPGRRRAALATDTMTFKAGLENEVVLPELTDAKVRVPAVDALLGNQQAVEISLYDNYLGSGDTTVFAKLAADLQMAFSADLAGGLSTPNAALTGLGLEKSAITGDLAKAVAGTADFGAIFGPLDAKLLGAVSLKDLLPGSSAGELPKMTTTRAPDKVVTEMQWTPSSLKDGAIFLTNGQARLVVHARIEQPLDGQAAVSTMDGSLTSFSLNLLDVVKVNFARLNFSSGSGRATSVDAALSASPVEFAGALEFIKTLQDVIPKDLLGNDGPAIDVTPTGVSVGYAVPLPPVAVGVFSLQNLGFSIGVALPFADGKPTLDVAFAKRDRPFIVTVSGFGGGGFVHVQLDPGGIKLVEAQLEFGGQFALNIGVASGGVQVMAGIYFKLQDSAAVLAGFVDLSGEVSVLGLITVSVEFNLTLSYEPDTGKARGRATLTVAVHVACFSKSVSLSVERSFKGGSGDPPIGELVTAAQWDEYAEALA